MVRPYHQIREVNQSLRINSTRKWSWITSNHITRYLPSDVTVKDMHDDYIKKNPEKKVSYAYYRKTKDAMNISFANLGHEEC